MTSNSSTDVYKRQEEKLRIAYACKELHLTQSELVRRVLYLSLIHICFMGLITALWNAGRVQGIREERARRKRKAQTIEQ